MPICRIITLQNEQEWAKAGQWLKERAHPGGNNDVENQVRDILNNVRSHGDAALAEYTMKFDCPDFSGDIRVSPQEIEMAAATVPAEDRECIAQAASNIRAFHENQKEKSWFTTRPDGTVLGQMVNPVARVGLYVPGGNASCFQFPYERHSCSCGGCTGNCRVHASEKGRHYQSRNPGGSPPTRYF